MNEALICDAVRTPFGRFGGALAGVRADDLAAVPLKALLNRSRGLDPVAIDDVILGCANQAGEDNRNLGRMAALLAGLPESVPGTTINRLCGSSMDAVAVGSRAIRSGEAHVILAGGAESMSRAPYVMGKAEAPYSRAQKIEDTTIGWRFINPLMRSAYGVDTMPETAENIAVEYGISREDQDQFALRSQQRAQAARLEGTLSAGIVPVSVSRNRETLAVQQDEHPRADTTLAGLSALKPVVRPGGTVTAGNASGINDGASALLLASREGAKRNGLTPRARIICSAAAGVPPCIMGMGPVPATQKALALAGMKIAKMDVIELNEAFAAQALAVLRQLGVPDDAPHVNPGGGAIALGHPLGASGARLIQAALLSLERTGGRYGLCTMCIGVGQGIAIILERLEASENR